MAETTYTYSIANDIVAGACDAPRLTLEIQESAITIALDRIDITGDELDVVFKNSLPAADKTVLDGDTTDPCGGIIGAHSGLPLEDPTTDEGIPKVHINGPVDDDGSPVVAANTWPIAQYVIWCGEGDDITNGTVGDGTAFKAELTAEGDTTITSQFIEVIRLGGGHVLWKNCEFGDYATFSLFAPATSNIVSNPGSGAYGKLAIPGVGNMIVDPSTPGADGPDWDVNLTEKLNANVNFTKAVPVAAPDGDGFFTYVAATDSLTYTPGTGTHNLFDADIPLAAYLRKMWLMGDGHEDLTVYNNIPATILPQWKAKAFLYRTAAGSDRHITWSMLISRTTTA